MCGITGKIRFDGQGIHDSEIQSMMDLIKHRGPDDEGLLIKDNIGIGHVRLSIIDLSARGHQPMFDNSNEYAIVFNGEIYNYIELKSELKASYDFKSHSDTEVILAAYLKWGEDCLHRFNGDWAFVIWHIPSGKVFGARDRYGIKPFYYIHNESFFAFASEVKALVPISSRQANHDRVFDYVVYNRTDHTNSTFYKDIHKVPHGHSFTIQGREVVFKKWYDLEKSIRVQKQLSLEEAVSNFKSLFNRSIELRLRSDVPVGLSLSGGLDSSSLLASILANNYQGNINTFSAIYKGFHQADESKFIDLFAEKNVEMFFVEPDTDSFYKDLPSFMSAHGEPTAGPGPYAQYKVMELAMKHVKVTLDGQGADEQLTGYHYFFSSFFKELLLHGQLFSLAKELYSFQKIHANKTVYKYWLLYMLPEIVKVKAVSEVNAHLNIDYFSNHKNNSSLAADLYSPKNLNDSLYQHFEYKLEHLLKWDDHNAMHFSIESRVPFLDHNLVEFTLGLGSKLKISAGQTKFLLRKSMKGILHEKIRLRQDKKGFSTPSDHWFRQSIFQEYINDLLASNDFAHLGIFNVDACKKTYMKHLNNQGNFSKEIWKWINLDYWYRENRVVN